MRSTVRKAFNTIAAIASLLSGALWHVSALAQVKTLDLATENSVAVAKLTFASAHLNMWAAVAAGIAGIALSVAIVVEK